MANAQATRDKILAYFEKKKWTIPDVAISLNIKEQYLRRILNNPDDHLTQMTDIIAKYKIR